VKNFFKNFFLPLKVRILIIIIFPVIFYPFIILYFNKYQEILINSEFLAMERQGITFAKAIGMAEDQYGLIEKNKISGVALQTLLTSGEQNFQLKATLYNTNGNLIADKVTLGGLVKGEVAANTLNVASSAKVEGNLKTNALSIDLGAEVSGSITRIS